MADTIGPKEEYLQRFVQTIPLSKNKFRELVYAIADFKVEILATAKASHHTIGERDYADAIPTCQCGLLMSCNPHPEAGEPSRVCEIGAVFECIPCMRKALHVASDARHKAESELATAKAEQKWIAVEERLPELTEDRGQSKRVIVAVKDEFFAWRGWTVYESHLYEFTNSNGRQIKWNTTDEVVYWQPLPSPPKSS